MKGLSNYLTVTASDHDLTFALERGRELLFTTGNRVDRAEHMLRLGIDDPFSLLDAAERWGEVLKITSSRF